MTPTCHLVKLGTMGEYGTPNIDIEEGYIEIEHRGRTDILPFPKLPGRFYHLLQGPRQPQHRILLSGLGLAGHRSQPGRGLRTVRPPRPPCTTDLTNRFDYDAIFGTVLNRFVIQAALASR